MAIKGDEFLKNVQVKQEEESLKQKLDEFENMRQQNSAQANPYSEYANNSDSNNENELGDILLQNSRNSNTKENKKKYIILGIALVLLFVITIVIIRLITSDGADDVKFQEKSTINQDKALNDEKIQQEYQQILTDKLKQVNETTTPEVPKQNSISVEKLEEQEEPIVKEELKKANPLNIEEPVVVKEEPKEPKKAPVVEKQSKKTVTTPKKASPATSVNGVFIQIGAFSKTPANSYLQKITSKGYTYKLHKVEVNKKEIVKVLIGPFPSRSKAKDELNSVRKTFEASGAYILKL